MATLRISAHSAGRRGVRIFHGVSFVSPTCFKPPIQNQKSQPTPQVRLVRQESCATRIPSTQFPNNPDIVHRVRLRAIRHADEVCSECTTPRCVVCQASVPPVVKIFSDQKPEVSFVCFLLLTRSFHGERRIAEEFLGIVGIIDDTPAQSGD